MFYVQVHVWTQISRIQTGISRKVTFIRMFYKSSFCRVARFPERMPTVVYVRWYLCRGFPPFSIGIIKKKFTHDIGVLSMRVRAKRY